MLSKNQLITVITGFIEAKEKDITMSSFQGLKYVKPEIDIWKVTNEFIIEWCRIFGHQMLFDPNSKKDEHKFIYMDNLKKLIPVTSNNHWEDMAKYLKANKSINKINEFLLLTNGYFETKKFFPWVTNGKFREKPDPKSNMTQIQHINSFIAAVSKQAFKMRTVNCFGSTLTIISSYESKLILVAKNDNMSFDILADLKLFYKLSISNINRYSGLFHNNNTNTGKQYTDFFIGDIPEIFEDQTN